MQGRADIQELTSKAPDDNNSIEDIITQMTN